MFCLYCPFQSLFQNSPKLHEGIVAFLKSKEVSGRRPKYLTDLRQWLNRFAEAHSEYKLCDVTIDHIEKWIATLGLCASSRNTAISRVSSFLSFAAKRKWIQSNPCLSIDKSKIDRHPPFILSPDQSETLLRKCAGSSPRLLAFVAMAIFAGVRPEECTRLTWADIDLERSTITISAAASKVRLRRIIHLRLPAVAWLTLSAKRMGSLPIPNATRRTYVKRIRAFLGFEEWPQDCLRHTAASYWLAATENAPAVALELGTSVPVLMRHYRELVSRADAERFWSILP